MVNTNVPVDQVPTMIKTGRSVRENYILRLQSEVKDRVQAYYGDPLTPQDLNSMYVHVRAILSLYLKKETGSPIKRGNNVLTLEDYTKCIGYLDKVLPRL